MMTRSGYCYGPIRQDWHQQISEILKEVKEILEPSGKKEFIPLVSWDQVFRLEQFIDLKREDEYWIMTLPEYLMVLRNGLSQLNREGAERMMQKIDNLIHEIRG
jgi:hypothetical protein